MVQEIAATSSEQNSGINQIRMAIEQLTQVAQQNSASAEELASSSEEMALQASHLKKTISFFKLKNNIMVAPTVTPAFKFEKKMPFEKENGIHFDLGNQNDPNFESF